MAKKKKPSKGRDSRGYGQHQPPQPSKPSNNKTAPIVSSQTHDGLKNLLGKLQVRSNEEQLQQKSSQSAESSDRFVTKLTSIVHRLQEFGFSDPQMEQVACALGYDMALDTCLDWLCLHLPTLELPSLFTDGRVRSSLMMTTEEGSSLTVLKLVAPPPDSSSGQPESDKSPTDKNGMLSNTTSKNDREEEAAVAAAAEAKKQEEAEAAAKQKAWLLQQYQFEEDDEEGEPDSTNGMKEHRKADTTGQPPGDQEATANTIMTPEEEYLAEKESELKELELDLNNEANNYMRSKHETKQLQIQVKKLRQEVIGLRKKIERTKAKQLRQEQEQQMEVEQPAEEEEKEQPAEEEEKELGEEEDYGGGGLFASMIESPAEASSARNASKEKETQDSKPKILDYCISKDWTGTTPQKTLDETCKKQRLPKPKYVKLPSNRGYRLVVTLKKKQAAKEWQATTSDFVKGSSLQDYLAIQALYEMDPSLPLYRMFPSSFRDLWLSWQDQVQQAQNQEQQEQEAVKRERIERLLALIADKNKNSKPSSSNATQVTSAKTAEEESTVVPIVHDNWDDGEDIQDIPITKNNTKKQPSAQGEKCRQNFVRRQATTEYQQMLEIRSALPMASFRQQVLDTVRKHSVTILCAETGAGKTTQCPQYLLEEALLGGFGGVDSVQILCTQPRRVAATSVAERVAEEMCESTIGKMVGYQIRMEAKRSAQTRLLFCTTGIVLRRLQEDSNLKGVTHVIVDEVHERQQQTDVLLIALRQLLRKSRPDLKVILMSATMDSKLFCSFFEGAPLLSVPGRTFPVSCYHLEDLMDATHHMIEEGSRCARRENRYEEKATLHITKRGGEKRKEVVDLVSQTDVGEVSDLYPGYKMSTRRSMDRVNEEVINYDLIEDVLNLLLVKPERNSVLVAPDGADMSTGSVLVFLPGLGEIRSTTERLEANRVLGDSGRFEIIPMHSTLSSRDQRRAFIPAKKGCRKIILSTNIAETSVTIPDVVCVVDCGREREVRRNKRTSTSILVTDWCSKASAKQRAGRAGRVQPGLCLKLYSSITAQHVMRANSEPELRRVPLEEVCLSILASGFATSCMDFLSQAPQPPPEDSVKAAINVLCEVGAINLYETDNSKRKGERLTPLGNHLAKLPVDVRLGKMLIFGALFRCMDKVLTIAAALSSQSPFSTFVAEANVAKAKQKTFANPDSDFLTLCNVWEAYGSAATSPSAGRKFCYSNYLSYVALREIGDARKNFLDLLCGIGFLERKALIGRHSKADSSALQSSRFNENSQNTELVHAVICAGLYPNVAHLEQPTASDYTMWHKEERLYFHNSSVNKSKKRFSPTDNWVVFHEKFGTPHRVSVSTTCFVHPFALLLLGGSVVVKHTERLVIVDDWIRIVMAAQIGVIMRELRTQVDVLLQKMFENTNGKETEEIGSNMIQGIVNILAPL